MKYRNNKTVKFILPLLTKLPSHLFLRSNFLGAFVGDVERPEYDGKILLAYVLPEDRSDLKFELMMMEHEQYYTSYDYDSKKVVVYVFNIPTESVSSVEYILDGKYSKIEVPDKLEIIKFWKPYLSHKDIKNTLLFNILYPNNGELWFVPDLVEELLDIDSLRV